MKQFKMLSLAALVSLGVYMPSAHAAPTNPQLSVQLWSVKDDVAADFEGTLSKLKAMGFQGVEFAGNFGKYGNDPKGLKAFLDKLGLKASAAHVPMDTLKSNLKATAEFYKAIGCDYLIVPMDKRAFTPEGAKEVAADLKLVQEQLAPYGLRTGYHNHKPEMLGELGKTTWEILGNNTPNEVILQQDVGWSEVAGKNPVDIIKLFPGRTITTHYKAAAPDEGNKENPIIGLDTTDWKSIIKANRAVGGTLWLVVEQEVYPNGMTPMQSVEASLKGLQKQIAELDAKK